MHGPGLRAPPNPVRLREARRTTRRSPSPSSGRPRELTVVEYSEDDDDELDETRPGEQEPTPPPAESAPLPVVQPRRPLVLRLKLGTSNPSTTSNTPVSASPTQAVAEVPLPLPAPAPLPAPLPLPAATIPEPPKPAEPEPEIEIEKELERESDSRPAAKEPEDKEVVIEGLKVAAEDRKPEPIAPPPEPAAAPPETTSAPLEEPVKPPEEPTVTPATKPKHVKKPPLPNTLPPTPPTRKAAPQSFSAVLGNSTRSEVKEKEKEKDKPSNVDATDALPEASATEPPASKEPPASPKPVSHSSSPPKEKGKSGHVCANCGAKQSPAWRRGVNNEPLCNACGLRNRGKGKNAAQNARLKAKAKEVKVVKKPVVEKKEREKEEDEEVEEREPRSLRKRKRGEEREEVAETKEGIKEPADEEPVDEGSETAQQNSSEDASEGHSKEEGKAANEEPAKEEHELDTHDAPMPQAEPSPAELEPIPTRTSRRPSLSNEAPVTSDKTKSIRPPVTSPDRPSRGKCFHCGTSDTPCFRRMKGEGDEMLCNACGLYYRSHGVLRPLNGEPVPPRPSPKKRAAAEDAPPPLKKAKSGNTLPVATSNSALNTPSNTVNEEYPRLDPDMDPATAALIQSLLKDATMTEKVKAGRRKGPQTAEMKSFAFFGEEGRRKPVKRANVEAGEGQAENLVVNGTNGVAGKDPPEPSETPGTPVSAAETEATVASTAGPTDPARPRKRRRWDMPPERYVETRLEGLLAVLDRGAEEAVKDAVKDVASLADYCLGENLFAIGAGLLRIEGVLSKDPNKWESAGDILRIAEKRGEKTVDGQLSLDSDREGVKAFLHGLLKCVGGL